jgi:hypothetical protein
MRKPLTSAISLAAAICMVASAMAWAQGQGGGGRPVTEDTNAATICTGDKVLDGDGDCVALPTDTDTSAATQCSAGQVLLGDGICANLPTDTDTSAATQCAGDQMLQGDGDCVDLQAQIDDLLFLASGRRFVFVTSTAVDGDLGGVAQADALCNSLAGSAGLPGTYKAWLASELTPDPAASFHQFPGTYILPDFTVVAVGWADLIDGTLDAPINVDENGVGDISSYVWTNVWDDGTILPFYTPPFSCDDWTSASPDAQGIVGWSDTTSWAWTHSNNPDACNEGACCDGLFRLYCFGQ